ncbi:MAG TPA: trypsin-like peptidase domain-containing protein [Pirellulales bacterium]|nr:trypsin-like peptidase domain-containing protein [Pirellulales bacterium]
MDQHLACPHCNQTVAVSSSLAGQAAQCPYCGGEFSVPGLAAEPQTAPMRQPANRNPAVRGDYQSLGGGAPRQPVPRQQGSRRPMNQPVAAGEGGSRLLIGVIVALVAACMPIFVFLGYRMLRRAPAVAAAPSVDSPQTDAAAGGPSSDGVSGAGAPTNAGVPPKAEQPLAVQPTNLPNATPSNNFTPPAASSPPPSVSPFQPAPGAFQAAPNPVQPAPAPTNPGFAGPVAPPPGAGFPMPPSNSFGGSSFGNSAPGSTAPQPNGPRPVLGSTRDVVQAVEPSVVVVEVPGVGLGSGFVIDSRGTIATNYHVIEGAKNATVTFPTDKAKFDVTGFLVIAPGKDLALLKIEPRDRILKALPLAETPPDKGESVLAFGAPKGFASSVSDGIVSSVRATDRN